MNSYFESEDFKELLSSYEEQLERGESTYLDADDYADLADYYLMSDLPENARVALETGLELYADNTVLLSTLCGLNIFNHNFEKAREIIETNGLEGDDILYMTAQLAYALDNDIPMAEKLFRKWLRRLVEDTPEAEKDEMERDSYLHIISSFVDLHDDAVENEADLGVIRRWIGDYAERFKDLGKYETDVQVADICRNAYLSDLLVKLLVPILDERPYMKHGWSTLALGYLSIENHPAAVESADFALAVDPHDKEAMLAKAYSCNCMENYAEAVECFDTYWKEDNIELAQGIPYASCLISAGDRERAYDMVQVGENGLEQDRIAKGLDDKERRRRYLMGMNDAITVYQDLGKYEDCERCTRRLIELDADNYENYFMLGNFLLLLKDLEGAVKAFTKAMVMSEDQISVLVDAAMLMMMSEYINEAIELVEMADKFIEQSGLGEDAYASRYGVKAMSYMKAGETDLFLANLKIAVEKTPELVKILFSKLFPENIPVEDYYYLAEEMIRKFEEEGLKGYN